MGNSGSGAFTQSGGTNAGSPLYSLLYIGGNSIYNTTGTGTYNLNAGLLSIPYVYVGDSGTGTFTQSGGTASTAFLGLGWQPGSSGTYNLNGGLLAISGFGVGLGSGGLNLNGGTLQVNSPLTITQALPLNTSGGTFTIAAANAVTVTLSGVLSGSGGLTENGAGVLALTGTNACTGSLTVAGGLLSLASAAALPGPGNIILNSGGAVLVGGPYTTVMDWLRSNLIAPASAGALALTAISNEPINMAGYPNLSLGASGAATYNGVLTLAGTTYQLGGGGGTLTFTPALTGANSLAVSGQGSVVLANTNNTFSGGTTLYAGQLDINIARPLGSGTLTICGGALGNTTTGAITLASNNAQVWNGDFAFAGTNNLNLGTGPVTMVGSRTVTVASNALTVGGPISDGGNGYGLTTAGTGTLILTGSDTYSGATTVDGGTLQIGARGGTGSINSTSGVIDNAVLAFSRSDNVTFRQVIGGSGNVTASAPACSPSAPPTSTPAARRSAAAPCNSATPPRSDRPAAPRRSTPCSTSTATAWVWVRSPARGPSTTFPEPALLRLR